MAIRFKLWHCFLLIVVVASGFAYYVSQTTVHCTQEQAIAMILLPEYPVDCSAIHRELNVELKKLGYAKIPEPEWAKVAESQQIGKRLNALQTTSVRSDWYLVSHDRARCFINMNSTPQLLLADVFTFRKLFKHQSPTEDVELADVVKVALEDCAKDWLSSNL